MKVSDEGVMAEKKVVILTDSIACIPKELIKQYGIGIIPLNFYANGRIYRDGVDVTPSEAYQIFLQDPQAFKTSASSPGDFLQAYRDLNNQGKDILCILLSSKVSAHYAIGCSTGEQVETESSGISVVVMDSQTAAAAEGLITLAAARAAAEGKNLDQVIKTAEKVRDKVTIIAYMDTIRYV